MKKPALIGLTITLLLAIPALFLLTRGSVGTSQFVLIVGVVLLFVMWTAVYMILVDPLLRRLIGNTFNLQIEWRGPSRSIAWTAVEPQGCLREMLIALFGYVFSSRFGYCLSRARSFCFTGWANKRSSEQARQSPGGNRRCLEESQQ